ncbi:LacI family DNA-binding transcriptional regulator [Bifidobacterium sp. ESL0790]|uniref:LacI family DNA-binding transcriptional regulator n=1 Tax=Bifidobacterium sp. ESL0790 TaxID=2983233 RepID=UPI0023FA0CBA|nr:LacI family DNA-binding transcriptional regulator [Bifidobacterium sp. ESL0790]WEV72932.1 LacI family DNA-binding transcriptional regulator [Bifidobacterium sp. ESL0790]
MVSLSQVAKKAGVSTSTVSRYLHGQLAIKADTEEKIVNAANELGYVRQPSRFAANSHASNTEVALIVPELTNPFYSALSDALITRAQANNLVLEIMASNRQARMESKLVNTVMQSGRFTGLIYAGMHRTNAALNHLVSTDMKLVLLDEDISIPDNPKPNIVAVDNYSGAYQATSYLIGLGHRRIAHISGPNKLSTAGERLRGYKAALKDAGIPFDSRLVFSGPYTEEYGANVLTYLVQLDERPTAVFAGSDIVAIGLISACKQYAISIPHDLSVVGCDGIRIGKWLHPTLTTLTQPIDDMASAAFNLLLQSDGSDEHQLETNIRLPLTLTIGESAARVKHTG